MEVKQLFDLLRKEAECSFCIHPFNEPKTLSCLHSFCLQCLNKYAAIRRQQGHTTFDCPVCLATFQLPDNDKFDAFQTAFHQNRLLDILALEKSATDQKSCGNCEENVAASAYCFECQIFLCEACLDKHNGLRITRSHRQASLHNLQTGDVEALFQRPVLCEKQFHERETLEYFCEDCRKCICHKCALVEHKKHTLLEIPRVAEQYKRKIIQDVEQMKCRVTECKQKIEKSKKNFEDVEQQIEETRYKAQATVEELIRDLKEHKAIIMRKLDEVHQTQQQAHLAQLNNLHLSLAQLNSAIEYAEAITTRNVGAEILQAKETITQRCGELLTDQKMTAHKPVCVGLVIDDDLCQTVHQSALGRVVVSVTDTSLSVADGKDLHEAKCEERADFTVVTKNTEGQESYHKRDQVTVHTQTTGAQELEVKIESKKDGTYHASYVPNTYGHRVTIRMNGQPLSGRWNVHVIPPYQAISSFGSQGTLKEQFNGPFSVSVSSTGNIAVADAGNKRVKVFTSEGKYLRKFGKGRLEWPVSVTYTSLDHIIVVDGFDDENAKALMFKECGTFLKQFSSVHLKSPWSIRATPDGRVVVCDWYDKAVKVLSPDGKELLLSFSAPDCTAYPSYAVCHKEKFFVSYTDENCIKVFDVAGQYLHDITRTGEFQGLGGVAVDKHGNLVVADAGNHRLQVFTAEGEFVSKIGSQGNRLGQFDCPEDVVSRDGRVYVTDLNNYRVQILV